MATPRARVASAAPRSHGLARVPSRPSTTTHAVNTPAPTPQAHHGNGVADAAQRIAPVITRSVLAGRTRRPFAPKDRSKAKAIAPRPEKNARPLATWSIRAFIGGGRSF